MKQSFVIVFLIFLILSISLFSQMLDKQAVENVIIEAYIHGLIDAEDFEKAKEGIHEDFIILDHQDNLLRKKTRDEWIYQRAKRPQFPKVDYSIAFIDIEGDAASAKIEMVRGNMVAVDYVFLYRFNKTWRIVSAIDHVKHIDN